MSFSVKKFFVEKNVNRLCKIYSVKGNIYKMQKGEAYLHFHFFSFTIENHC